MGLGGVATAALPSVVRLQMVFSDRLGGYYFSICAIFKDESLSIKEWIEYHKLIGVEHFYLYNNKSKDSSVSILQKIQYHAWTLINC